jgi:hypothetical protein
MGDGELVRSLSQTTGVNLSRDTGIPVVLVF